MAVYLPIAILLRLPLCGFKCLKVHYSCSKHRKSTGRENATHSRDDSRPLDFVTSTRTITSFPPLFVLPLFCAELCKKPNTSGGKGKPICNVGSPLWIRHLEQVVLIRNVQRASIILRNSSNVSLLGKTVHRKGEACEEYFRILSWVCVWKPGLAPLLCSLSPNPKGALA